MMDYQERHPVVYFQKIAEGATIFNTKTGEGNPSAIKALKLSSKRAAKIVLSNDPTNVHAIALLKWTKDKKSLEPNIDDLINTFKAAGLITFSASAGDLI